MMMVHSDAGDKVYPESSFLPLTSLRYVVVMMIIIIITFLNTEGHFTKVKQIQQIKATHYKKREEKKL